MAASASTSTSTNDHRYDVFINHRGPDVKKTFASHLYRRLLSHGLTAFLDQDELETGLNFESQIKEAIRTASFHVAIFSPTYAQSEWCLKELVLMLESEAPIIPVFHQVKPAEVRHTREGGYAQALQIHGSKKRTDDQPRHDSNTIEKWRNALSTVAGISGLELEECNQDEGVLVDKVVGCVLQKLERPLDVAKHPTGLEEKVEELENSVLSQHHNGGRVGITGLGGVGKTTLALELFNRKKSSYSKSHFLPDVREKAKSSLPSLQTELLKVLFHLKDLPIYSRYQGTEMLRKHLSSSKVLVVLDDVDDAAQVDALLPVDGNDSLILITSRDKNVLVMSGVQEPSIYNLRGLNRERSTELFCSHAFCQPHPLSGFESLVDKFVRACHGLPLSLKVVGASLSGNKDKSYWQGQLDRLQKTLPEDIKKSLRISYDALKKEEQHIFIDIACFLVGENKGTAIRIWNESGWNGWLGFQTLLDKCLVELGTGTVNYDGSQIQSCIRMHDHLRDMGRDLAQHSGLSWRDFAKHLGLPSRLWRGTKINYLLQQSDREAMEVRGIRGIRIVRRMPWEYDHNDEYASSDDDDECASASCYSKKKLQLLDIDIEADRLECILSVMPSPNLIWLRWHNCPCSSLPPWIPLKKLRVLEVTGDLEKLWQDGLQAPVQLQELEIRARLSNIPKSIAKLKHLERIVVTNGKFEELPEEFCQLPSLKHLQLMDSSLRSLPDSFGNLTNLEHIDLSYCISLKRLPISFGCLIKLKYLVLSYCYDLTLSSGCFGNISTLEYVDLTGCTLVEVLPSQIAHQRSLEKLDLYLPSLKEWPSGIGEPSSLEKLVLRAPLLKTLPSSLGRDLRNLKYLELQECQSLKHCQIPFHC